MASATQPALDITAPPKALTQAELTTVQTDPQEWDDPFAVKIGVADFQRAETYRMQNHDRRFREADQLLTGWNVKKMWQGTRIPRSSVPVFIAMQEIEVLQARVIEVIFSDNPPFEVAPGPGSTLGDAYAVRELLASQLRDIGMPGEFMTIREIARIANKSALTYGCGIVEPCWYMADSERTIYDRQAVADTLTIPHPQTGEPVQIPTGQIRFVATSRQERYQISKPVLSNIDVRDFYVDQNCNRPSPQAGQFTATRQLVTIEDLKKYSRVPGFKIPQDSDLLELANRKFSTMGDTDKQAAEGFRGNNYQPLQDSSADPALKRIEVIRYWRKNRHVWILGRAHAAFNQSNPLGIIPHLNAFYIDFLGRFYGFSIADLVEGDHKLAMAILNSRIDELNLILHAPIIRKRGAMMGASGKQFHPGANWEVLESTDDIKRMEMGAVNPGAFMEVNALEMRVQKLTGNTDVAAFGVATAGGDSSQRTAHGVAAKQAAGNVRIEYQVENFEDQFLEPLLYILLALDKRYLNPNQLLEIMADQAQLIKLDPLTVMNASVRFEVRASQKMRMRQTLQSGGLQMILSTYMNPGFQSNLHMEGRTLNMENIDRITCDGSNIPQMSLTRPMTQDEIQRVQQPPMAEMIRMKMQEERLAAQAQNQDAGDETQLLKTVLHKLLTPDAVHGILGIPYAAEIAAKAQPRQLTNGK